MTPLSATVLSITAKSATRDEAIDGRVWISVIESLIDKYSMKIILAVLTCALLSACIVAPGRTGQLEVRPHVEVVYVWDPITVRYYYVYSGDRHYMPREWRHPRHYRR